MEEVQLVQFVEIKKNGNMTYKFNDEFERRLKGVKTKFIKNIKEGCKRRKVTKINEKIESLNKELLFYDFISAAFVWGSTPEKHAFWSNVANRE